jgi:predicted TIM-barrel fold metal-dependent hydrolase
MMRAATAIESSTWTDAHLHLWDSSVFAALWLANAPQFSGCFDFSRSVKDSGVGGGVVLGEANVAPR